MSRSGYIISFSVNLLVVFRNVIAFYELILLPVS